MDKDEWSKVKEFVKSNIGESAHTNWIQPIELKEINGTVAKFKVPTRFIGTWVHRNYGDHIIQGFKNQKLSISRLEFVTSADKTSAQSKVSEKSISKKSDQRTEDTQLDLPSSPLDARFTFDKFITGPSNELAFASAKRIAQSEKFDFNPLFLYGGVGLGKTHLMHSIAWEISTNNPSTKVLYLSAERFMFQFIKSLRQKDTMSFKQKFRSVDVLILDDIQFMVGKNSTQEEFFHTFNSLLDLNKKVILSSDRAPSDLEGFDERIKSRLSWGLVADILPASFELRYEILKKKSAELLKSNSGHHVVDDSVLIFLAKTIVSNVRELEGALNKVVTFSNIMNKKIDVELTKIVLKDLLRSNNKRITIDEIQNKVSNYYNINTEDLISSRRLRSFARPRQVAMYLAKKLTSRSLPEIGRKFGGRDHTTVIHAVKKIDQLKSENEKFDEDVSVLTQIITSS